jgi:hypothetical protein
MACAGIQVEAQRPQGFRLLGKSSPGEILSLMLLLVRHQFSEQNLQRTAPQKIKLPKPKKKRL